MRSKTSHIENHILGRKGFHRSAGEFVSMAELLPGLPLSEWKAVQNKLQITERATCKIGDGSRETFVGIAEELGNMLQDGVNSLELRYLSLEDNPGTNKLNGLDLESFDVFGVVALKYGKVTVQANRKGYVEITINEIEGFDEAKRCLEIARGVLGRFTRSQQQPLPVPLRATSAQDAPVTNVK